MPTYVYVANADDGEIATYLLNPGGELEPRGRAKAAAQVAPMAVSPDQRLLYAAVRSKPFSVHVFRIDPASGALSPHSVSPLAESCPYLSLDRTGRTLFGASYGAHLVIVKDVGGDGGVAPEARQVIPVGRNAHAILAENGKIVAVGTDADTRGMMGPKTQVIDAGHAGVPVVGHDPHAPQLLGVQRVLGPGLGVGRGHGTPGAGLRAVSSL